jgi:hypothetical protein
MGRMYEQHEQAMRHRLDLTTLKVPSQNGLITNLGSSAID